MVRRLLALGVLTSMSLAWTGSAAAEASLASATLALPPAQHEQPGRPIVVRWSTESEVNTAGFNIYRAERENGLWTKINPQLIPPAPDPVRGGTYAFTDTQVTAGQAYWYELEAVELDGSSTRLRRTQTTAQAADPLASLPCAGGLIGLVAVGLLLTRQRWTLPGRAADANLD